MREIAKANILNLKQTLYLSLRQKEKKKIDKDIASTCKITVELYLAL